MKKMSKGMLMTALICGAVYLGGSPVYASELQEFSLDEYVVTAARMETKLVDTPANISVVDAQTIEERHYQDVSEVLKDVPGANVMDAGVGAFEKAIALNGDARVLVLVDGRRVDFASGTTSRASYDIGLLPDVNLIERIEILKGAGGALYGSDAVGGVVNIITKKATKSFGKVSVGMGSMGAEDYNVMYSHKEKKTGVTISAAKLKQDYFKYKDFKSDATKRWPMGSDFDSEKISLKLEQELNNDINLEIGYDYSKYEGHNTGYISNSNFNYNDKKTENIFAKLNWNDTKNNQGYLQFYHNELDYYTYNYTYSYVEGDTKEKTNGVDLQQSFIISDKNKLVGGFSWRDSKVDNPCASYNESIDSLAFFINDTWDFASTWSLNTGIRYDDYSQSGNETTFSAGLNKKFNDNSHAYFNWGQVFKVPTTGDLFSPASWGGNPDLVPETGETWTLGYATKINDKTDVNISYFESDLEDAIRFNLDSYKIENVDKQKKRGLELSVNHNLNDNVDLVASYSYIEVKQDNGTGFVKDWNYIPNTYRLGVNYHDGKWDSNIWLRAASGGATHMYSATKRSYADSSYLTVDLSVTYKATKDLSFYAKGYNLFNEAYAERGGFVYESYDYPAQSRRFIVGAEYKF